MVDDPSRLAFRLARRLSALPEPAMRGAVLAESVLSLPVDEAATIIAEIIERGRRGGPPFELALGGLRECLQAGRLPYPLLCDLYATLRTTDLGELAVMLLPGRPPRDVLGEPGAQQPGQRELTLGERKSLARAAPREVLDRLLRDPEPQVIRLLLFNGRLVERDVVLIAARRGLGPEVARELLASPRWIARPAVREALALNPDVPEALAIQLLPLLRRAELVAVRDTTVLPPSRREAARRLVERG